MWKGRKRIEFTILERKSPTLIDKLVLQLDRQMGQMIQEGDTAHILTRQGEQFGGGGLGANSDIMHEAGDDFWDYMVESADESLFIASGNQVNQPSPS